MNAATGRRCADKMQTKVASGVSGSVRSESLRDQKGRYASTNRPCEALRRGQKACTGCLLVTHTEVDFLKHFEV